jgi:hypothetical protein
MAYRLRGPMARVCEQDSTIAAYKYSSWISLHTSDQHPHSLETVPDLEAKHVYQFDRSSSRCWPIWIHTHRICLHYFHCAVRHLRVAPHWSSDQVAYMVDAPNHGYRMPRGDGRMVRTSLELPESYASVTIPDADYYHHHEPLVHERRKLYHPWCHYQTCWTKI